MPFRRVSWSDARSAWNDGKFSADGRHFISDPRFSGGLAIAIDFGGPCLARLLRLSVRLAPRVGDLDACLARNPRFAQAWKTRGHWWSGWLNQSLRTIRFKRGHPSSGGRIESGVSRDLVRDSRRKGVRATASLSTTLVAWPVVSWHGTAAPGRQSSCVLCPVMAQPTHAMVRPAASFLASVALGQGSVGDPRCSARLPRKPGSQRMYCEIHAVYL
jgi:hypothetical protein